MKAYLVKLAMFAAIQAGIILVVTVSSDRRERRATGEMPRLLGDQRLEAELREWLYPFWLIRPGVLDDFAHADADSPIVRSFAEQFANGPDNYLATLADKDALLRSQSGPRLIFVGGSGLAFGLDSQVLADRYEYSPVNLGLHIRLGPEFMLRHAEQHVRPGDVVVLCIEYDGMMADFETTPERQAEICNVLPGAEQYFVSPATGLTSLVARLGAAKRYADRQALPDFAGAARQSAKELASRGSVSRELDDRFDAAFRSRRNEILSTFKNAESLRDAVYARSGFNAFGDLTSHWRRQQPPDDHFVQFASAWPATLPPETQDRIVANVERLNAFARSCETRNVRVFFCYPPVLARTNAAEFGQSYSSLVERHLEMPILFPIEQAIFDRELFYDTPNHLNWRGIQQRMSLLARGLDRHLEPTSSESIEDQLVARDRAVRGGELLTDAAAHDAAR